MASQRLKSEIQRLQQSRLGMEKKIDEQDFQCPICYDPSYLPISCQTCKKLFCYRHIHTFSDRCPNCRASPFKFLNQTVLEPLIEKYRQDLRVKQIPTNVYQCGIWGCKVSGNHETMKKHWQDNHPNDILQTVIYGPIPIIDPTFDEATRADFVAHRNNKVAPAGQKKKSCEYEYALRMVRHVTNCDHETCYAVYAGPWGPFIGGKNGRTHFDLTECKKGKLMNQAIGWDYKDFRH